jgi:hypothetical protein
MTAGNNSEGWKWLCWTGCIHAMILTFLNWDYPIEWDVELAAGVDSALIAGSTTIPARLPHRS